LLKRPSEPPIRAAFPPAADRGGRRSVRGTSPRPRQESFPAAQPWRSTSSEARVTSTRSGWPGTGATRVPTRNPRAKGDIHWSEGRRDRSPRFQPWGGRCPALHDATALNPRIRIAARFWSAPGLRRFRSVPPQQTTRPGGTTREKPKVSTSKMHLWSRRRLAEACLPGKMCHFGLVP
jgi:hypothetical protein